MEKNKKSSLRSDMKKLAKEIYELSKIHGNIYVSATCTGRYKLGIVTYGNELKSVVHWDKNHETL